MISRNVRKCAGVAGSRCTQQRPSCSVARRFRQHVPRLADASLRGPQKRHSGRNPRNVELRSAAPAHEAVVQKSLNLFDSFVDGVISSIVPNAERLWVVAATQAVAVLAIIAFFHLLGLVVGMIHSASAAKYCASVDEDDDPTSLDAVNSLTHSSTLLKPLVTLLPWLGYLLALQRAICGLDEMHHFCESMKMSITPMVDSMIHQVLSLTEPINNALMSATGILFAVYLTWTVIIVKQKYFFKLVTMVEQSFEGPQAEDLKRILVPANQLTTWLAFGVSAMLCLRIVGLDPRPILALGSVSGIVVGFASQQVLLNLMAGVSLFITRPFVVGDIVEVRSGSSVVARGAVTRVSPLRTSFLSEGAATVTLPNKMLTDMVIVNVSDVKSRETDYSQFKPCKHMLKLEFGVKPLEGNDMAHDELAKKVVKAALVRLSVMKGLIRGTVNGNITGFTKDGKLQVSLSAIAETAPERSYDKLREDFVVRVHKSLCSAEAAMA